ncbi:MAG: 3'(2'),5'-bisphosphate nucleotidase CysQ [Actinomycetota bacterium]
MPPAVNTRDDDHQLAQQLADSAGELLLSLRDPNLPGDELKRRGDQRAHLYLVDRLAEERPADAVLSEEGQDDPARLAADRVWIVDPLDGTREYGEFPRDDWAVHVALWQRGRLVAGAVSLPARGVSYRTGQGGIPPTVLRGQSGRIRLAVSRSRPPAFVVAVAERLNAELIPMGSAGVKAMSVVADVTDGYVHAGGQYEWDSAAPVAVCAAAGLHTSRIDGSPLIYNRADPLLPDLVVCKPDIAESVLAAIHEVRSEMTDPAQVAISPEQPPMVEDIHEAGNR